MSGELRRTICKIKPNATIAFSLQRKTHFLHKYFYIVYRSSEFLSQILLNFIGLEGLHRNFGGSVKIFKSSDL